MNEISKNELLKHFMLSRGGGGRQSSVTLLVGAGASLSAGIPLAAELAQQLISHVYSQLRPHGSAITPNDQLAALRKLEPDMPTDWPSVYPAVFRHFLKSPDQQRDALESCLGSISAKINWAHLIIGLLVKHGYVGHIITTNFDEMVADSCRLAGCDFRHYDRDNAPSARHDKPVVMQWHGRIGSSYRLRNAEYDLKDNTISEAAFMLQAFRDSRLLVIVGYAGEEGSVMDNLTAIMRDVRDAHIVYVSYSTDTSTICARVRELANHSRHFAAIPGQDADSFFAMLLGELPIDRNEWRRQCQAAMQIGKTIGASDRARAEFPDMLVESPKRPMDQALAQARSLAVQGRFDSAVQSLDEALGKPGAPYWELAQAATILHTAGARYASIEYLRRAEAVFADAAEALAREAKVSPFQDIMMNHARAAVARDTGIHLHDAVKLREALAFARRACELFPATTPPGDVAEFWQRRGAIACDIAYVTRNTADATTAIAECSQAATFVSGRRDIQYARTTENLGYAHGLMATVMKDAQDDEAALRFAREALGQYARALSVARTSGDHMLIAHIQLNAGNAHMVVYQGIRGDTESLHMAQSCFEESYSMRPPEASIYDHYLSGTMMAQSYIMRAHAEKDTKWISKATLLLADIERALGGDQAGLLAFVRLHQANAWKVGSDVDKRPDLIDSRVMPALETAEKLARESGSTLALNMIKKLRDEASPNA